MPVRPQKKVKEEDSSTVMLMLGLFLILLAFFILMNAISELVEDRVEEASKGVMSGFGFKKATTKMPNQDKLDINEVHEKITAEIRRTMETYLSIKDFSLEKGAPDTTLVQLNPLQFYPLASWRLKSSQAAFFSSLSNLLTTPRAGVRMTIDIRMPEREEVTEENEQRKNAKNPLVLGGYRATNFARALIERGVDAKNLTTGVSEEQTDRIMLIFRSVITNKPAAVRAVQAGGQP